MPFQRWKACFNCYIQLPSLGFPVHSKPLQICVRFICFAAHIFPEVFLTCTPHFPILDLQNSPPTIFLPVIVSGSLKIAPNLISCTLKRVYARGMSSSFLPLRHPRLLNLHIPANVDYIFSSLTFPVLRFVYLCHYRGSGGLSKAGFINLLSRSSCILENFVLDLKSIHLDDLLQCLNNMQNLKVLYILDPLNPSKLLRYLTPDERGACLCPKLQVIQLHLPAIMNKGALMQFVQSRRSIVGDHEHMARLDCIQFTGENEG